MCESCKGNMLFLWPPTNDRVCAQATMDWEAQDEGVLAKILAPDGTKDIAVGTPVAVIVDDAGDVSSLCLAIHITSEPVLPCRHA